MQENEVDDRKGHWLSCFPDSCTSLTTLNFACLRGEVNVAALERLVARCRNLKSLRLNHSVPPEVLHKILAQAPQLNDLGTEAFVHDPDSETGKKLKTSVQKCTSIRSLSGFLDVNGQCLSTIYPICRNLLSLNLSYAPGIYSSELMNLLGYCKKLERLWVRILLTFLHLSFQTLESFCLCIEIIV